MKQTMSISLSAKAEGPTAKELAAAASQLRAERSTYASRGHELAGMTGDQSKYAKLLRAAQKQSEKTIDGLKKMLDDAGAKDPGIN